MQKLRSFGEIMNTRLISDPDFNNACLPDANINPEITPYVSSRGLSKMKFRPNPKTKIAAAMTH